MLTIVLSKQENLAFTEIAQVPDLFYSPVIVS